MLYGTRPDITAQVRAIYARMDECLVKPDHPLYIDWDSKPKHRSMTMRNAIATVRDWVGYGPLIAFAAAVAASLIYNFAR